MWRIISLVVIGFWLMMTTLLVRYVWYPEGSRFSDVSPKLVLRRFLEQSSAVSTAGSLWVFHRDKYLGTANIRCTRVSKGSQNFQLRMAVFLEKGAVSFTDKRVSWFIDLKLVDVDQFGGLSGHVRIEGTPWIARFSWQKGQRVPVITVDAPEEAGINNTMIQLMMAQAFAGGGVSGGASPLSAAEAEGILRVRATEREMDFAGQKSRGHLLDLTVMDRWKARVFITEAGEFVLLDLPEGYRLIEPVINNLVPDFDDEDEVEQATGGNANTQSK